MSLSGDLSLTYRESWAFVRKAWWLVPVPVVPAVLLDLVWRNGLIQSRDYDALSIWAHTFGSVLEVLSVYWVMRFLALRHDIAAAISVNRESAVSFAPYLVVMSVFWIAADSLLETGSLGLVTLSLITIPVQCLAAPWSVVAPSGSKAIGPVQSFKAAVPKLPGSIFFLFIALLPVSFIYWLLSELDTMSDNVGLTLAYSGLMSLGFAIYLLLEQVTIFVIAHRMGLRINSDQDLHRIFG